MHRIAVIPILSVARVLEADCDRVQEL